MNRYPPPPSEDPDETQPMPPPRPRPAPGGSPPNWQQPARPGAPQNPPRHAPGRSDPAYPPPPPRETYYPANQGRPQQAPPQYAPQQYAPQPPPQQVYKPRRRGPGCLGWVLAVPLLLLLAALVYFLAPLRTNILLLGIDRDLEGGNLSRTDTMILTTVIPLQPYVGMLSIPRDLWVPIEGVGEQRINTAHYFAEANQPGSGPEAAVNAVEDNFGVPVSYYARVRFDSLIEIVDAMGGVWIDLPEPTAGLEAGRHHLDAGQALAFARDRKNSGDDIYRGANGQALIRAMVKQAVSPQYIPRWPQIFAAAARVVDTNVPVWLWPRLGLAMARATSSGIDNHTLDRDMIVPTVTQGGAQVLLPNWDAIRPLVSDMFGG